MVGLTVHHIQVAVRHGSAILAKLQQAGFKIFATSTYSNVRQWAVRSSRAQFLITEMVKPSLDPDGTRCIQTEDATHISAADPTRMVKPSQVHNSTISTQTKDGIHDHIADHVPIVFPSVACPHSLCDTQCFNDTVFNVAFEPRDIETTVNRARDNGAEVLHELRTIHDGDAGCVRFAIIKSCIGNIVHTLLDTSGYRGVFLPGFRGNGEEESGHSQQFVSHFDHITLACHEGSMNHAMEWYQRCLGMKRFYVNRIEDEEEGMVVRERSSGLRLKALEYWRCSEEGLSLDGLTHSDPTKPAFVFAEAIAGPGPNQISTFLTEHGCEGVQHIGLYTPDICDAVQHLTRAGLRFIEPPAAYYTELSKQEEVKHLKESLQHLKELSILVDTEESLDDSQSNRITRYLMQVFSKPLFDRDTFFLELIQREGSLGFGSGNIKALWRALDAHIARSSEGDV